MSKMLRTTRILTKVTFFITAGCLVCLPITATPPPGHYDHGNSQGDHLLLRASASSLDALQTRYGLTVVQQRNHDLTLVAAPQAADLETLTAAMAEDLDVESVEVAKLASLPQRSASAAALTSPGLWQNLHKAGAVVRRCLNGTSLETMWAGYTDQWALDTTRLQEAQLASPTCGAGVTVAIIDTGVDRLHPALQDSLVPGYDFLTGEDGSASEWNALPPAARVPTEEALRASATQSVQQILEGNGDIVVLDSALGVILDPAMTSTLEGESLDSYFGHGTMVAGLIRLSAPAAAIMPLRVFDGSGSGHLYDIVDAIYYAVDHGADVINMSFSMDESSIELKRAIKYAREQGVVTVAAAGNNGSQSLVFPAAYGRVVGVASTTEDDLLSDFSNYGAALVKMAAPGDGVISAFPGNHYAAGWGTSFATPLVAGTVALLLPLYEVDATSTTETNTLLQDLFRSSDGLGLGNLIGRGRLNSLAALYEAANGGNN